MFDEDEDDEFSPQTSPTAELSADVQALIKNGLEFLDKARKELEASEHKFSIVSFWTAVEILLKVPLVHEHWTLVCSGKKIVRSKYISGDFQSVTYDETCARLGDVLESPLNKETMAAFDKIRQHRNRVVHFFHPAFSKEDQLRIQKEQADAWFALNRLMRDEWQTILGASYNWRLAYGETRMLRGSEFYSELRLKQIQPELDRYIEAGNELKKCPDCGRDAVTDELINTESHDKKLYKTECKVCSSTVRYLECKCPECKEVIPVFEGDDDILCVKCQVTFERSDLLTEEQISSVDEDSPFPAGCTSCMKPHSVIPVGKTYLCVECLNLHKDIYQCQCCFNYSDSVSEFSEIGGCDFCEGDSRYRDD